MMHRHYRAILGAALLLVAAGLIIMLTLGHNWGVLDPKGLIAHKERELIMVASLMTLIVVVPVFVLTFGIAWKYRASNIRAKYTPDWDHHLGLETLWWGVPALLILVLGVITWKSSHELDPFRPLASITPPITIQVVALDWKWLFIYPELGIASVNYVQFPEQTPVHFEVTGDAPMNSFWIPQLGGQIYAMAGMSTQLQLMADAAGTYRGSSANLSGRGFSGMNFMAKSTSQSDFYQWAESVRQSRGMLGMAEYSALSRPSQNNPTAFYTLTDSDLYNKIIMKYMASGSDMPLHTIQTPSTTQGWAR